MFYYYIKTILLYDLRYTLKNFYFSRVFIISLISINVARIFILLILIEVKFNILNIFSKFYV